jgi:uncharacterized protein
MNLKLNPQLGPLKNMNHPPLASTILLGALLFGCSDETTEFSPESMPGASGGDATEEGNTSTGGSSNSAEGTGSTGGVSASGGQLGGGGELGSGGDQPVDPTQRKLEHVLAYNLVDFHPETKRLRGHDGGGEDEALLQRLGMEHGFSVEVTDDPRVFTEEKLSEADVVVFASPHYIGQKISDEGRDAIENFVRGGGGWIGFHYALKIEVDWPFLKVLGGGVTIGGHAKVVPDVYSLTRVEHFATADLPISFQVADDYLAVRGDLRAQEGVDVLATVELAAQPGAYHPTIWAHDVDGGRAFYSMPGHLAAPFKTEWYRDLVWGALRWTARIEN